MTALTIPDWLHAGVTQAQGQAMIVARQAYKLSAVRIDLPVLILPLAGTKRLELGPRQGEIAPGQFLMIHHATCLQVENLPPAGGGESYRAWVVALPWHVVELARTLLRAQAPTARRADREPDMEPFTIGDIRPLLPMLQNLLSALGTPGMPDAAMRDHGLLGVALALARSGHGHFLHACDPALGARIRLLVAADPARAWSSADFEERLHISGATLRRRLAEENTSLRALLREARLHHGLALLQTTRKPVKSVAQACGYRSVPSFTRNFVAHFGIAPSAVANP